MEEDTHMFRVRFHGRGGQGMKTASRILGSAAFQAGLMVQDSPLYGAERRGAPMMAFTRIATEPIFERGIITQPDIVVVADETLLADAAAQPLAGCGAHCTLLINSAQAAAALQAETHHAGRLLVADFTTMSLAETDTLAGLSTALGIAAAGLIGLSADDCLAGLEAELRHTHLTAEQVSANQRLAGTVYAHVQGWEAVQEQPHDIGEATVALVHIPFAAPAQAAPSIYAIANTPQRRTGNWRQFRPVLQQERCTRCWLCFVWCPEAAITLDEQEYPRVDYTVCKGCLLCAHECPTHAFTVEKER